MVYITSAIFEIAIYKGYIEGVNIPISTYFPQTLEYESEYKNQINIWIPMVGKNIW